MKIPCPGCDKKNYAAAKHCVYCGRSFDDLKVFRYGASVRMKQGLKLLAFEFIVFALLAVLIYALNAAWVSHRVARGLGGGVQGGFMGVVAVGWLFVKSYLDIYAYYVTSSESLTRVGVLRKKRFAFDNAKLLTSGKPGRKQSLALRTEEGTLALDPRIDQFEVLTQHLRQHILEATQNDIHQEKALEAIAEGKVYQHGKPIVAIMVLGAVLFGALLIRLFVGAFAGEFEASDWWMWPIPVIAVVACVYTAFALLRSVSISTDSISEHFLWRKKTLRFDELSSVRWERRHLVLRDSAKYIRLSKALKDYPELIEVVKKRVGFEIEADATKFPFIVQESRATFFRRWGFILGTLVLPLCAFWFPNYRVIFLVATAITGFLSVQLELWWPRIYIFDRDKIELRMLVRRKTLQIADLENIELRSLDDASEQVLVLAFSEKEFALNDAAVNMAAEELHVILQHLYGSRLNAASISDDD